MKLLLETAIPKGHAFSTGRGIEAYAIGDVHGRSDLLARALDGIAATPRTKGRRRKIVLLGDLIDRGPDSLGCIDLAMQARERAAADEAVFLMGNHEQFALIVLGFDEGAPDIFREPLPPCARRRLQALRLWKRNGGDAVLGERKAEEVADVFGPDRIAFLRGMEKAHVCGGVLFVHGGLPPRMTLEEALAEPMDADYADVVEARHFAWVRHPFLYAEPGEKGHDGRFVVHGHSPPGLDDVPLETQVECCSRINLDGGSYRTGAIRVGRLAGKALAMWKVD